MMHDRDFAWLALLVWMAPAAFATAKEFYYWFGLLVLLMSVLAEIAYWLRKRNDRLRAELAEAHEDKPSNLEFRGATPNGGASPATKS